MIITQMRAEHVGAVAKLHTRELTGLLRALGTAATRAFYAGSVGLPASIAFVALDGSTVCGFVWGSLTPRALKLQAIARKPMPFTVGAAIGVLLHPSAIPLVWKMLRGAEGTYDAGAPELTYLAVAPEQRRSGVGRKLVNAFSAAVRGAGAMSYDLSVDHDNFAGESFYKRLGFVKVGAYREFGIDHRRYRLDVTNVKS